MDAALDAAAYSPQGARRGETDSRSRRFAAHDRLFLAVTGFCAALVLLALTGILVALVIEAWPALREFGSGFLVGPTWSPADDVYGAVVSAYGTIATSAIALLLAVPLSFGIAVFLTEMCPAKIGRPVAISSGCT